MTAVGDKTPAEYFDLAVDETKKAWNGTPMLARISLNKAENISSVFSTGSPKDIALLLLDMIGQSWSSISVNSGVDAQKVSTLGSLAIEMAIQKVDFDSGRVDQQPRPADFLSSLLGCLRNWVTDASSAGSDLQKVNKLMRVEAKGRLLLISAYLPAICASLMVVNAKSMGYPFAQKEPVRERPQ